MNPILRNLISVIRRFKLAAALNILGLSVAFAAFTVIMIQLNYDFGFEKCHKDYDKIFRVELTWGDKWQAIIPRPYAERFFESSPFIVAGAVTQSASSTSPFYVEKDGKRDSYEENSLAVAPEFFDVFTFDYVEGSKDNLAPGSIFIPLSLSRKLFGNEPAVGRQIIHNNWGNQTVAAVYRDFPANTIVANCIYYALQPNDSRDSWGNSNCYAYIRVNDASNAPLLFDNFQRTFDGKTVWGDDFDWGKSDNKLRLTALRDIHFITDVLWDKAPKANRSVLLVLFAIAIITIAIATINYTNFCMALMPVRAKSINMQRVLGARQRTIRWLIVLEAIVACLFSYVVSIVLVSLFQATPFTGMVNGDLSFAAQPLIFGGTAIVALFTGLLAGIYPARFMTAFVPAFVLSGNFGLSPKGKMIRNTLIEIQFISSFALIIGHRSFICKIISCNIRRWDSTRIA